LKSCDKKRNKEINENSFKDCLNNKIVIAENCGFHLKGNINDGHCTLVKDTVSKIALSGIYMKGVYLNNYRFAPFIYGKSSIDYIVL
jgi:hypothetical protein